MSEGACRAVLGSLGVAEKVVPAHLGEADRVLRRGLRAKARQLGDTAGSIELLVAECAFEQWHRLLFARFLAENNLLIHPQFGAPVTLAECEELADEFGEPDGWGVAGRFAAEILPGIFRLDDPCVQLRLAPEGRLALESIVAGLPAGVFATDDALGWVYQYWQRDKKDEVNASERKIGGADLGPVTQLFTENYMVRFLLENSLGAWWAARHPDSPLIKDWEFLRFDDDGKPFAGSFDGWPTTVAEVTVMDPCCGSGHFLVEAFSMLWQMRAEEERLAAVAAQDAVLADNLFGLELDPRCVQIAMFAVALTAWKAGGGWRELPTPHVACSGIPVKAPVDEWKQLADGDERLENALARLHVLFRDADTLGSLIDPKRSVEITDPTGLQASFDDVGWDDIAPLLADALTKESDDPATAVLGADAAGIAHAADYLSRHYTLIATNVPYLGRSRQAVALSLFLEQTYPNGCADLATSFLERAQLLGEPGSTSAIVCQDTYLFLKMFAALRRSLLLALDWNFVADLGPGAFREISGNVVRATLLIQSLKSPASGGGGIAALNIADVALPQKIEDLRLAPLARLKQDDQLRNPAHRIAFSESSIGLPLGDVADARNGISVGDGERFERNFWEILERHEDWERLQTPPSGSGFFDGMDKAILWEGEEGSMAALAESVKHLNHAAQSWRRGKPLWGRRGVVLSKVGAKTSVYCGQRFDSNCIVIVPESDSLVPALVAFASSGDLKAELLKVNPTWQMGSPKTLLDLPFDVDHWRAVALERFPGGLPEPCSDDPTQWLFEGRPDVAAEPLQVAVGRLLGFCWPEQADSDDLRELADEDGIVCLSSVLGEHTAADRLLELLAQAFGGTWSPTRTVELLAKSGSKKKDLESWLRDEFFKQHCKMFQNRPFIWHIWDGRKDGFSALVNCHRLNLSTMERLTYTYLGDWIERQTAGVRDDVAGAEERLVAAEKLQRKLGLILDGEPPYDVYVRWKSLAEQSVGWDPDLNDGVRLNVRPFVEAGVLRSKFNVHWKKDRGKNPDGTERHNDVHYSRADKETARKGHTT
ncbi:BREX-1 system adenine-specific DNA-methyltransferase PglX [Ilumatobacter sp.]|nr:BREX-1 system adenine-specific DNA-methyltransferase PglX [Ilumatobacter sp.]